MAETGASAGIFDHCGWAVAVCVAADRRVLDSRLIELIEPGLPSLPHHHQAQRLPIADAVALIERVRRSAESCARRALDELPAGVRSIAMRKRPVLPPTVGERITSYWAQTRADSVMYRDVLAEAARARGWAVNEYNPKSILAQAADALGLDDNDLSEWLTAIGKTLGPPWRKDHKLATAAAIVAAQEGRRVQ